MKTKKLVLWIGIIFIFIIAFEFILNPAYQSTKMACYPNAETTWIVTGQTIYNEIDQTVTLEIYESNDITLKHEFIHYNQITNRGNKILNCGIFGSRRFLIEIEAYTGSYLPNPIYKKIYGDYTKYLNN